MKVRDLVAALTELNQESHVFLSDPVAGDCENLSDFIFEYDERVDGFVIFPHYVAPNNKGGQLKTV